MSNMKRPCVRATRGLTVRASCALARTTALGLVLSGCAGNSFVRYATGAHRKRPSRVGVFRGDESLVKAGLVHPATVWIPRRYAGNGSPALFIDGRPYVAPGGYARVVAFTNAPYGYLVAVREPAVANTQTNASETSLVQAGGRTVFYRVTTKGHTLGPSGSLPVGTALAVPGAIYIQEPTGTVAYGELKSYSYVGLNTKGTQIAGPQDVLFATPAPASQGGGWFVVRLLRAQYPKELYAQYNAQIVRSTRHGTHPVLSYWAGYGDFSPNSANSFVHTTGLFVNMPNYVDSWRTGAVVAVWHHSVGALGGAGLDWFGSILLPAEGAPKLICHGLIGRACGQPLGQYEMGLGALQSTVTAPVAGDLVRRAILFGSPTDPYLATQMSGTSDLWYGYIHLAGRRKGQTETKLVKLAGGIFNFLRGSGILGGSTNTGTFTTNTRNDALGIISPRGVILIMDNPLAAKFGHTGPLPVFDITAGKRIHRERMASFLLRYGVAENN